MMTERKLSIFITISILFHVFLFFTVSFYLKSSNTPFIFSWPSILSKDDLSIVSKPVEFIPGIKFTQGAAMDKTYFLSALNKPFFAKTNQPMVFLPEVINIRTPRNLEETDYLYLWEKPKNLVGWDTEIIPYKALVSPYGKVILSFPQKLPLDSDSNISSQEYAKEAALFLKNKFLWTKMEVVVR